jgi:hypothetical protein
MRKSKLVTSAKPVRKYPEEAPGSRTLRMVQRHFENVTTVTDAKEDVIVTVLPKDVSWAAHKNHSHCALARACTRSGCDAAIISRSTAILINRGRAARYMLSSAAAREIVAFDRGAGFSPGEYLLKAPPKTQRLGKRAGSPPRGKITGERRRYVLTEGLRSSLNGS